jgi:hypothetical protein
MADDKGLRHEELSAVDFHPNAKGLRGHGATREGRHIAGVSWTHPRGFAASAGYAKGEQRRASRRLNT